MARRKAQPPLTDPSNVPDAFASGFVAQDWEDWVRIVGWADDVSSGVHNGGTEQVRRKSVAVVIPRSSVPDLIEILQQSVGLGGPRREKRHS